MTGRSLGLALLVAATVTAPARRCHGQTAQTAQPSRPSRPSQEELARSHFVAGEQEYARGRWREALHEFEAGYALSPRPEFLINFAQVHRKLGDYDAAERECRQYLATAPPAQLATQAQRLLDQIEDERAHALPKPYATPPSAPSTNAPTRTPTTSAPATSTPATSTPATSTPTTSAPTTSAPATSTPTTSAPTTSAPATSAPSPAPVLVAAPPPPPQKKRRAWIAPVVIAGVVVVAGAVTLGLLLGLPAHDTFKTTPLGTVDFR
jgi:hypothetical protein